MRYNGLYKSYLNLLPALTKKNLAMAKEVGVLPGASLASILSTKPL